MSSTADRLSAAVADRYRIERELGQGGMATVYPAEDLRHRRKVAMKVLRPELAATLGPDRFFRESRSPPNCSIRTSCRSTTPARPTGSSTM
jgi:serine/threonine-protein kinase